MPEPEEKAEQREKSKSFMILGAVAFVSLVIALGLIFGLAGNDDAPSPSSASNTASTGPPPPAPTVSTPPPFSGVTIPTPLPTFSPVGGQTPNPPPTNPPQTCLPQGFTTNVASSNPWCGNGYRGQVFLNTLSQVTGQNTLLDGNTPQGKAYAFLLNYDPLFMNSCSTSFLKQRYALMTLYFATSGDFWTQSSGWCSGQGHCDWQGVTCSTFGTTSGSVTELELESNNLVGELPNELWALPELREINLFANSISGPIPGNALNFLSKLETIDLQQNLLSGSVLPFNLPPSITSYKVSGNRLTGTIPSSVKDLLNLKEFWAGDNQISGELPAEFGTLFALESVYLFQNELGGAVPEELSLIPLKELWLSNNFFEESIPETFFFLGSLEIFRMDNNLFSGEIPTWIGLLTNLQDFRVNDNNIEGTVPNTIGQLTDLVELHIGNNFWAGNVPNMFNQLNKLEVFDMSNTELQGAIPNSLFSVPSLKVADFSDSKVTGGIPSSFSNSQSLEVLHLDNCPGINGNVPGANSGRLQNLQEMLVQGTSVSGAMPASICALKFDGKLDTLEADCKAGSASIQCDFPDCCTKCH